MFHVKHLCKGVEIMQNLFEIIRTKNINDLKQFDGDIFNYNELICEISKHTNKFFEFYGEKITQIEFHLLKICDYLEFSDDIQFLIVNYNDCMQYAIIPFFDGEIQPDILLHNIFGYLYYTNLSKNVSRETLIKNIYYNGLLSHNDINDLLNDLRNDGIIEKQFDFECLRDNLLDLFNDNIETIVNEILSLYDD